jgi:branched-chain amino acid transport system substrate-binding protein
VARHTGKLIHFGTSLSLTGPRSIEGRLTRDGYEFAINEINRRGGIPVGGEEHTACLTCYDDGGDAGTAARGVEELITEHGIALLLGPYGSALTLAASEVAERYRVPMVAAHCAATTVFERGHGYIFGTLSPVDRYFGTILEMAAGLDPRPRTVALIDDGTLAPRLAVEAAARRAAELGMEVVAGEGYASVGAEDLAPMLARVRGRDPDIVLAAGYTADTIPLTRRANEAGLRPRLFGLLLGPTLPGFMETLGPDADHLLEPVQWSKNMPWRDELLGWTAADYAHQFEEEYAYDRDYHPPQSSAAVMVYCHALRRAGTLDPRRVRDAIAATDVMTFYGPIRFNARGQNVAKPMAVVQIQNREPVVVYPREFATGELVYPIPRRA